MERSWSGVRLDGWRPYAWLSALIALLYLRCLSFGLILLDDNLFLVNHYPLLSDWRQLPELFRRGAFLSPAPAGDVYYRPLMMTSFMIDAHLWGQNAGWYHLSNILFHLVSTALVMRILDRLCGRGQAFLLAAVFAVHPALASSVAWICGRTDSFAAMSLLASFHCFQLALSEGRRRWIAGHLAFLAAAYLSKELAVVAPAACVSYAWLVEPRRPSRTRQAAIAAGWLLEFAAWLLVRKAVLHASLGYSPAGVIRSMVSGMPAFLVYWGKALLPVRLSPYPILRDEPLVFGWGAALAALAALAASRRLDRGKALWGLCWFSMFLAPSFVYPDVSITPVFFEYRLYLPLLGLLVMAAETDVVKSASIDRGAHAAAAAAVVFALAAAAWASSAYYKDDLSAWSRAVEAAPHSAFAHKQLGTVRLFRNDFKAAAGEYLRAIELNPREPMAHNNMGVIFMRTGRLTEAEREYRLELGVNPNYDNAWYNLGLICAAQGRLREAAAAWRRVLAVNPEYGQAQDQLDRLPRGF